jgi:hypothetical protein
VGRWVYRHRKILRIAAVVIAALVLAFIPYPTGQAAVIIAIVLLVVLGLIELVGRPPAHAPASAASGVPAH